MAGSVTALYARGEKLKLIEKKRLLSFIYSHVRFRIKDHPVPSIAPKSTVPVDHGHALRQATFVPMARTELPAENRQAIARSTKT
jgi:hypothetical protein